MQAKPRSTTLIYLLCALAVAITFGCRSLLPEPENAPGEIFPTEALPVDFPSTDAPEAATPNQASNSEVTVTREQKYYQITGNTEKELRQQMDTLGLPEEETGKIFDARTDWVINWYFYYNQGQDECKIDRVEVSLALTYTYPQWDPPANADPKLVKKWNKYFQQLNIHEEVHGKLAAQGAQTIYETIMQMPAAPTCETLGQATNAAALEAIAELKQRQRDYDDETGHGKTQGAVFP